MGALIMLGMLFALSALIVALVYRLDPEARATAGRGERERG